MTWITDNPLSTAFWSYSNKNSMAINTVTWISSNAQFDYSESHMDNLRKFWHSYTWLHCKQLTQKMRKKKKQSLISCCDKSVSVIRCAPFVICSLSSFMCINNWFKSTQWQNFLQDPRRSKVTSSPELKGQLTRKLVGNIRVTCR